LCCLESEFDFYVGNVPGPEAVAGLWYHIEVGPQSMGGENRGATAIQFFPNKRFFADFTVLGLRQQCFIFLLITSFSYDLFIHFSSIAYYLYQIKSLKTLRLSEN